MKYVLIGDDMFYRTLEGLLLKCLGPTEANRLLHEVHEGACGTHQSAHKIKWLIRRSGYYWPTMLEDSFKYYKGCQACQRFRKIQMVSASVMNLIIKPWPFRGWDMDMIGKINPPSSKGHQYILAITDYLIKWVEVIPMKTVASKDVINFIKEHVIHRFGIPQTITTDGGSVFISEEFRKFAANVGIKLIRSSPYYAQANGRAEASNRSLIKLIKRKINVHTLDIEQPMIRIRLYREGGRYVESANAQSFIRSIMGTPHFMSRSNENLIISSSVWIGGRTTTGNYGRLKTRGIPE
jgi:hypothetical protein